MHLAVLLPSFVVTDIVAVPAAFAETLPEELTVAILLLLELQVTFLLLAPDGWIEAESCYVFPLMIEMLD